jgi:hypothetical protein
MATKNKTQITLDEVLELIVEMVREEYPIYDLNQAVEFLLAKGTGAYLQEQSLSYQDLLDIQKSKNDLKEGKFTRVKSGKDLLSKLKE